MTDAQKKTKLATVEARVAAKQLRLARDAIKEWKKIEEAARTEVLEALDGADALIKPDGEEIASVAVSTRHGVDSERLEALHPDVFADVQVESEVRTVNVP